MTHDPDDKSPSEDPEGRRHEGDRKLDEDAAWRSIVEHYGDRPKLDDLQSEAPPSGASPSEAPPSGSPTPDSPPSEFRTFAVFERRWEDPLDSEATWEDEGHFTPPEPPPVPPLEPRRKLAWIGMFGAPAMMLAAVVFGWRYPTWFAGMLVLGFVGGFVYLVATMPRHRDPDDSGDDGAVV